MNKRPFFLIFLLSAIGLISFSQVVLDSIPDGPGYTYIASPTGSGPFPAVLYNHGGLGTAVGGDLRGTVVALAQAGYIARAEKRMETIPMTGHLDEVKAALDSLRADPRTDTSCVSIMGFSRGGLLSLQAAKSQHDNINALISMAPASGNGQLASTLSNVSTIDDPVMILVANNDSFQDDHVALAYMVYDSLTAGGKTATINIYPDYDSNGDSVINSLDDGHNLFFLVQEPYWSDVIAFLNAYGCGLTGLNKADEKTKQASIFPNPFSDKTTIRFSKSEHKKAHLRVLNIHGQVLKVIDDIREDHVVIEKGQLCPGLYFFQLYIDEQLFSSGRFVMK